MSARLRLPRAARIRDEPSVHQLQAAARTRGRWFAVGALENGRDQSRLLIRIAKKVMKSAVDRNRMRRCVKEVFRHHRARLAVRDFLVVLIRPYRELTLDGARRELEQLLGGAAR